MKIVNKMAHNEKYGIMMVGGHRKTTDKSREMDSHGRGGMGND